MTNRLGSTTKRKHLETRKHTTAPYPERPEQKAGVLVLAQEIGEGRSGKALAKPFLGAKRRTNLQVRVG